MTEISLLLGTSGCFYLLYSRKSNFISMRYKLIMTSVLFIVGGVMLLSYPNIKSDLFLLGWNLCIPFVYFVIDRFFKYVSMNVFDRDFILWLQFSDEIDDSLTGINDHVSLLDIVLSMLSLIVAFGLPIVGVILARGIL